MVYNMEDSSIMLSSNYYRPSTIREGVLNKQNRNNNRTIMKPTYLCNSCKQYHPTCQNNQLSHSNSIKFLKFQYLYSHEPNPHPQNFTVNSPSIPGDSRLVYNEPPLQIPNHCSNIKKTDQYNSHSQSKQAPRYCTISHPPMIPTPGHKHTRTSTTPQISKKSTKAHKNGEKSNKTITFGTIYQKQPTSSPYYVISKHHNTSIRKMRNQEGVQDFKTVGTTTCPKNRDRDRDRDGTDVGIGGRDYVRDKITPMKSSFVYGDSNRKILTSATDIAQTNTQSDRKFVREWKFGELVESRHSNVEESKVKVEETKVKVGPIAMKEDKEISGIISQSNSINYSSMAYLREQLRQNEKFYRKRMANNPKIVSIEAAGPQKQSSCRDEWKKQDLRDVVQILGNTHGNKVEQENKQKQYYHQKYCNTCKLGKKCKYFDNRCLGLPCGISGIQFLEEGQVSVGELI